MATPPVKVNDAAAMAALAHRAVAGDRHALEALVAALRDDVYNLAVRMLGDFTEAEDAAQDILIQVITNLGGFRGESALRTWVWRIASRHLVRRRQGQVEATRSFDAIEALCRAGDTNPAAPALHAAELEVLAEEIRITCTEGMLLSLDREHRLAYILAWGFDLDGDEGAAALEIEPDAFRKRVSRARQRLAEFMDRNCSLVNPENPCSCHRQIPVALAMGVIRQDDLAHGRHAKRPRALPVLQDQALVMRAARVICDHPEYIAPERISAAIRKVIDARPPQA